MEIKAAKVFLSEGSMDWIALKTTQPNPNPEYGKKGHPLQVQLHAPEGTGIEYVKSTFGIEPLVGHMSKGIEVSKAVAKTVTTKKRKQKAS